MNYLQYSVRPPNCILIGFMGAGKTSVAQLLGQRWPDYTVKDMDTFIEHNQGKTIPQLFGERGEAFFRKCETAVLQEFARLECQILSTGGGIILSETNRATLKAMGITVFLAASPETIYDRIKDEHHRPLLNTGSSRADVLSQIQERLNSRLAWYVETADLILNTDQLTIPEIVDEIDREYGRLIKCLS